MAKQNEVAAGMDGPEKAYIALGSNVGNCEDTCRQALKVLGDHERVSSVQCSSFVTTPAVGPIDQDDYVNAVAEVQTTLLPYQLLDYLHEIEDQFGRKREEKWGPRTLDLDLLLYEDGVLEEPDLILPHPQMHLRSFVLHGMCELAPDFEHPVLRRSMVELASRLNGGSYWLDLEKPQLVSVTGLIGVGKTTLAEGLARQLDVKLVREEFDKNPYLDQVYEGQEDKALDSELFFLSSSATQMKYKRLREGKTYVSDYIFEKARIYARQWLTKPVDLEHYQMMYESVKAQVHPPVLVVYIEDTLENCLDRIRQRQRPFEQQITLDFLAQQRDGYEELFANWQTCPLIRIKAQACFGMEKVKEFAKEVSFYIAKQES